MRRRQILYAASAALAGATGCVGQTDRRTDETVDPNTTGDGTDPVDEDLPSGVADAEFEVLDTDADGPETASVERKEGSVRVEGTIETPTPCHTARLNGVVYNETDGVLIVDVRTRKKGDSGDAACAQRIAYVGYGFGADVRTIPETVRVNHDGETVATHTTDGNLSSG